MITEIQDTLRGQREVNPLTVREIAAVDNMTQVDESREEVHRPMSLCTPKDNIYIGCWNVRSMYTTGKTAQIEQEMDRY